MDTVRLTELVFTFVFVLVFLCCTDCKGGDRRTDSRDFAVGLVFLVAGGVTTSTFGALLNPAVIVALEFVKLVSPNTLSQAFGHYHPVVLVPCQVVGAVLAALAHSFIRADESGRIRFRYSKPFGEFLGTFVWTLTSGLGIQFRRETSGLFVAASLTCMSCSLRPVSGAHLNPATTLGVALSGRGDIDVVEAFQFVLSQIFGAVCGAGLSLGIALHFGAYPLVLMPQALPLSEVLLAEFCCTLMLVLITISVSVTKTCKQSPDCSWLTVGLSALFAFLMIGKVSGAILNPALSVGIGLIGPEESAWDTFPYFTIEILAGGVAALLFRLTHVWKSEQGHGKGRALEVPVIGGDEEAVQPASLQMSICPLTSG